MPIMHHACLLKLAAVAPEKALLAYGTTEGLEVQQIEFENLGIAEVRSLIAQAYRQPLEGKTGLLLVVCLSNITFEAQQALLKILEEPPRTTGFLFCVSNQCTLLPTLTSRFHEIFLPGSQLVQAKNVDFSTFLGQSYAERLLEVSKRVTKKDTEWLHLIKQGLAEYVSKREADTVVDLRVANLVLTQLGNRGASNKMLLEALALTLPVDAQK